MGHDKKLKEHADEISKFQDEADAAQKCLDEAKRVKEEHDLAQKKKSDELDDAKKKHDDAIIAHAVSMNAKKEECEKKEQVAREEGRKAGLQACPGVNGLMREIWRLRQKLGAADAANDEEEEEEEE